MTVWVCSKCGLAGARVSEVRPSLDDRYAVGFCDKCAPFVVASNNPKLRADGSRPTVALIRSDLWDAQLLDRRHKLDQARKLLRDYGNADETGAVRGTWRGHYGVMRPRYVTEKQAEEARKLLAEYDAEQEARKSA